MQTRQGGRSRSSGARGGWRFPCLAAAGLLGLSAAPVLAQGAPAEASAGLSHGDTAWMLISAALVMLMVPGLALFYGGMVRRKNVLATMLHSVGVLALVGVEWVVVGYALTFGSDVHGLIGWDWSRVLLWNVMPGDLRAGTHVPEYVFAMYQGMFAIITPALIAGAFAERVTFRAYALFAVLWSLVVYNPVAHWIWGGGWMGPAASSAAAGFHLGALDFAGGMVVHVTAGASALVTALYLGRRIGYPNQVLQPNSLVLTLLGAGLLWFGWFGFNGGSAIASDSSAALAFTTTQIAAAGGALTWLLAEWLRHGKPTTLGVASGLVAGLATITPCAGYVSPAAALLIGGAAGVLCYGAVLLKGRLGYDDSLDAFGVHGVGGFFGALCLGVFARLAYNPQGADGLITGQTHQFVAQLSAAAVVAVYAMVATWVLVVVLEKAVGFRASEFEEIEGLDVALHGEQGWMLESMPEPSAEMAGTQGVSVDQSVDQSAEERDPTLAR